MTLPPCGLGGDAGAVLGRRAVHERRDAARDADLPCRGLHIPAHGTDDEEILEACNGVVRAWTRFETAERPRHVTSTL